jgi:hypothetical protein
VAAESLWPFLWAPRPSALTPSAGRARAAFPKQESDPIQPPSSASGWADSPGEQRHDAAESSCTYISAGETPLLNPGATSILNCFSHLVDRPWIERDGRTERHDSWQPPTALGRVGTRPRRPRCPSPLSRSLRPCLSDAVGQSPGGCASVGNTSRSKKPASSGLAPPRPGFRLPRCGHGATRSLSPTAQKQQCYSPL